MSNHPLSTPIPASEQPWMEHYLLMTGILFLIIIVAVVGICYEAKRKRNGDASNFWHVLWESITFKAINYFFNTSNAKIVITFLRSTTWLCSLLMFGWPAINGHFSSTAEKWEACFALDWGTFDSWVFIFYLVINAGVICIYLWKNKEKQRLCDEDRQLLEKGTEASSQTLSIVSTQDEKLDGLTSLLKNLTGGTFNKLLPTFIDDIKALKFESAHKNLLVIKEEAERFCPDRIDIISKIYLWLGNCEKYSNIPKCIESYNQAYKCLFESNNTIPVDVLSGKIFSECVKENHSEAIALAEKLKGLDRSNPWGYIPEFIFSTERNSFFDEISARDKSLSRNILHESCLLFQIKDKLSELDSFEYEINELDALTFDNLSEWIFSLYIAVSRFSKTTFYTFDGRAYKTQEVKTLYNLTTNFLRLAQLTEIRANIPDAPLYQAISGYQYTKDFKWIQSLEGLNVRNETKAAKIMALSVGYFEQGKVGKALEILEEYKEWDVFGVIALRCLLLLRSGKLEELRKFLQEIVERHILLPYTHIALIFNIVKCAPMLYDLAERITLETSDNQQAFSAYVKALGGNKVDQNFILGYVPSSDVFKFYYPIVLHSLGEKEKAYEILSKEIEFGKLDGRGLVYIEILRDLGHKSELYKFLKSLRENGTVVPYLLAEELSFAENLHNFKDAVAITGLLMADDPSNAFLVMHRFICLHRAKESNAVILNLFEKTRSLNFSVAAVTNITSVLFSRGLFRECVDFMYEHTIHNDRQELKDLFFEYSTNSNIRPIIEEQFYEVHIGDYIMYEEDGEEMWELVTAGSNLESLVGAKAGEKLTIPAGYKEKEIIINGIWTKYFMLLREVMSSIQSNKSKTIWSVTIDELGPDVIDGMSNLVNKYRGKEKISHQQMVEAYRNGEIPLYSFIKNHAPIHSIMSILLGQDVIYSAACSQQMEDENSFRKQISSREYVLDITSSIIICDISISLGLIWKRKFIIPQSLLDLVEQEHSQLMNQAIYEWLPSPIMGCQSTSHPNLEEHPLTIFLNWLKDNCLTETDDRKLDIHEYPKDGEVFDSIMESRLLATKYSRILISEDTYLNSKLANVCPSLGSQTILWASQRRLKILQRNFLVITMLAFF